jgi:hypothetical protein
MVRLESTTTLLTPIICSINSHFNGETIPEHYTARAGPLPVYTKARVFLCTAAAFQRLTVTTNRDIARTWVGMAMGERLSRSTFRTRGKNINQKAGYLVGNGFRSSMETIWRGSSTLTYPFRSATTTRRGVTKINSRWGTANFSPSEVRRVKETKPPCNRLRMISIVITVALLHPFWGMVKWGARQRAAGGGIKQARYKPATVGAG